MFKELKDFTKQVHPKDLGMQITVEEMIDAPFFQVLFDKQNNFYKIFKSNGDELSVTDIILNSMYSDIDKFIKEVFTKLSEKEKVEIRTLKRGECLIFAGDEHILTKIESGEFERKIIEK